MILDASLVNTQHYKVRIKSKWSNPEKEVAPSRHLSVVAMEKGAFGEPSANLLYSSELDFAFNTYYR